MHEFVLLYLIALTAAPDLTTKSFCLKFSRYILEIITSVTNIACLIKLFVKIQDLSFRKWLLDAVSKILKCFGIIHVLRNHGLGGSDPPTLPLVITFST